MRVRTASRLHFGLLSLPGAEETVISGGPALTAGKRRWGSVGLMVRRPGVTLHACPAPQWQADGPSAPRVMQFVERFLSRLPGNAAMSPLHFSVSQAAPEHQGLGTGTQLGLAVARTLAAAYPLPDLRAPALARFVGRGERSAIGVHGFDRGGFLVEAGKLKPDVVSPLAARVDFPSAWRIVVSLRRQQSGMHGLHERTAFKRLRHHAAPAALTNELCRLILLGLLPALHEENLPDFGEALYELNRKIGELFQEVQGGVYGHPSSQEIVSFIRQLGVRGAGQSSWGPCLFAVTEDEVQAEFLMQKLRQRFNALADGLLITEAANRGAMFSSEPQAS